MAFEFCCPNAPVDTPGLLPDTNGDTCGVCRLMPGFPGFSGSPTAAEWSDEHLYGLLDGEWRDGRGGAGALAVG